MNLVKLTKVKLVMGNLLNKVRDLLSRAIVVKVALVLVVLSLVSYGVVQAVNILNIGTKEDVAIEVVEYQSNEPSEEVVEEAASSTSSKKSKSNSSSSSLNDDSSSSSSASGTTPEGANDPGWVWDETPPVLTNLMVSFENYNPGNGTAGDFLFDAQMDKVIGEFGRTVSSPSGPKTLPQFDFFVTQSTQIFAPLGGKVVLLTYQPSTTDYSIHIRPTYNSPWLINFDHIRNVPGTIVEGASIAAGQYIGTPGSWFFSGFFELMVTYDKGDGNGLGYCPFTYLSSGLKATYTTKINNLISQWETFKSDTSIYDEGAMVAPGCLTATSGL